MTNTNTNTRAHIKKKCLYKMTMFLKIKCFEPTFIDIALSVWNACTVSGQGSVKQDSFHKQCCQTPLQDFFFDSSFVSRPGTFDRVAVRERFLITVVSASFGISIDT